MEHPHNPRHPTLCLAPTLFAVVAIALSACASSPVATAVVETVEPTAEPTAVPTVVPTPTADPLDLLRSRIHELLGDPYEAESFRAENAKTPDEEAALLAAVPLADRAEFAHDYLILPTALDNLSDLHNFVEDPVMCAPPRTAQDGRAPRGG